MTTQFLQSRLWSKIHALAKQANRRYVAVAYLGKGATDLLPMRRGDVLVVDSSLAAVRAGQTNPIEIGKHIKEGVAVYSYSNLHAKVFVFDDKAIIGSTNVSHNSRDNLVEAAMFTTDKATVNAARGFVIALMGEKVTPAYLRICKKEFRPSRIADNRANLAHPTLWVHRNYPLKRENPKLNRAYESGLPTARKRLKNQRLYTVDWLTYSANSKLAQEAKIGDLFISIWLEDDGQLWVYPHSRIINFKPYTNQNGSQRKLVFLEVPKSPKRIKWQEFKAVLKEGGITRPGEHIRRAIHNPDLKHSLLGMWPSVHEE
jgi:hypothetical protein